MLISGENLQTGRQLVERKEAWSEGGGSDGPAPRI